MASEWIPVGDRLPTEGVGPLGWRPPVLVRCKNGFVAIGVYGRRVPIVSRPDAFVKNYWSRRPRCRTGCDPLGAVAGDARREEDLAWRTRPTPYPSLLLGARVDRNGNHAFYAGNCGPGPLACCDTADSHVATTVAA